MKFLRYLFPVATLLFLLPTSGAKCGKKPPVEYPPPPPNVRIETPTRTAQAAGAAIAAYIPAVYRSMPLRIRVVPPKELFAIRARDRLDPRPEGVTGIVGYAQMPLNNPDTSDGYTTIFLSDKLSEKEAAEIAGHEVGHAAFWLVLDDRARAEWQRVWLRAKQEKALPTRYAEVSRFEGFAECFMLFYAGRLTHAKYEPLRAYMSDLRARFDPADSQPSRNLP